MIIIEIGVVSQSPFTVRIWFGIHRCLFSKLKRDTNDSRCNLVFTLFFKFICCCFYHLCNKSDRWRAAPLFRNSNNWFSNDRLLCFLLGPLLHTRKHWTKWQQQKVASSTSTRKKAPPMSHFTFRRTYKTHLVPEMRRFPVSIKRIHMKTGEDKAKKKHTDKMYIKAEAHPNIKDEDERAHKGQTSVHTIRPKTKKNYLFVLQDPIVRQTLRKRGNH